MCKVYYHSEMSSSREALSQQQQQWLKILIVNILIKYQYVQVTEHTLHWFKKNYEQSDIKHVNQTDTQCFYKKIFLTVLHCCIRKS